jgi:outer membrane biosynthesis protein TonB
MEKYLMKVMGLGSTCILGLIFVLTTLGQDQNQKQNTESAPQQTSQPELSQASEAPNSAEAMAKKISPCKTVKGAKLLHMEQPDYPGIAKKNHICGELVLHATIAKDGSVQNLQYMSGPVVFTDSAIKAARKWKYRPTFLCDEPVDTDTTIRVVYSLGNQCDNPTAPPHLPAGTTPQHLPSGTPSPASRPNN